MFNIFSANHSQEFLNDVLDYNMWWFYRMFHIGMVRTYSRTMWGIGCGLYSVTYMLNPEVFELYKNNSKHIAFEQVRKKVGYVNINPWNEKHNETITCYRPWKKLKKNKYHFYTKKERNTLSLAFKMQQEKLDKKSKDNPNDIPEATLPYDCFQILHYKYLFEYDYINICDYDTKVILPQYGGFINKPRRFTNYSDHAFGEGCESKEGMETFYRKKYNII